MDCPRLYQIRLAGHLSAGWSERLAGMAVAPQPGGTTLLSGRLPDQASLHGLLAYLRDLGLEILSIHSQEEKS